MQKYNKAIGAILGGLLAILVNRFGLPEVLAEETTVQGILNFALPLLGTFFAPKNKE